MNENDEAKFYGIIAGLAEIHGRELSSAGLKLWWRSMQHWSIDQFTLAANYLARACEFMPKPVDFEDMRRHSMTTSPDAWGAVLELLPGGYREGGVDELIDEAVQSLGGYYHLAHIRTDQLDFQRKHFVEAYETLIDQRARAGTLPLLIPVIRENRLEQKP